MYKKLVAERLTTLRQRKGVTQEEVAHTLSVSDKTISKWETEASEPSLEMLIKLAGYYNVSTDSLLGIAPEERPEISQVILSEFTGLNRKAAVLKAFEIVKAIIPSSFEIISSCEDDINDSAEVLPSKTDKMNRYCISAHEFYDFVVTSEDVNMAVMLMRNKADFKWLKNEDKQKQITKLFAFLSDTDALKICEYIHSTSCPEQFTADYIAIKTKISEEKAVQLLEASCEIGLCLKIAAHLKSGITAIYESMGNGNILSLITLAYEQMCGRQCYNYNYNGRCKMIGGNG